MGRGSRVRRCVGAAVRGALFCLAIAFVSSGCGRCTDLLPAAGKSRELLDTKIHGFRVVVRSSFSLNTRRKAPSGEYDYTVGVHLSHDSTKTTVHLEYPLSAKRNAKDTDKLVELWQPIGLEHCQHASGLPLVYRVTGVSPELDQGPQQWRALLVFPTAAVLVLLDEPSQDCQTALASLPKPKDFLRAELQRGKTRQVVTASETSVFPRTINAGYIISVLEGVNLREALDFRFRAGKSLDLPPRSLGVLPDTVAEGKERNPDIEAHFLDKLLPEPEPSDIPRFYEAGPSQRFAFVFALLQRVGDAERKTATVSTIAKRCKERRYVRQCHPFRLRAAAWIAREAKDTELCDAVLGLLPDVAPPDDPDCLGDAAASRRCELDRAHRMYMLLHLAASCGTPLRVRDAALATLRAEPPAGDFGEFDCEKKTHQSCPDLYRLAASILTAHCSEEVVAAAREWLSVDHRDLAAIAPCLLAQCGGKEELDRAVAAGKLTEQQATEALSCKLEQTWRPAVDGGAE